MKKMIVFLKPYWFFIGLALLFLFVELGVELIQPLFMAKIIDEGILSGRFISCCVLGLRFDGAFDFFFFWWEL